jgi:hypothetical protein
MFPEIRPRHKNKEKADLEAEQNERNREKAIHLCREIRGRLRPRTFPLPYSAEALTSLMRAALPRSSRM